MATSVTLKPNAIDISGSTSGTTTLQASAVAGTTTLTLPAATDTLVGKTTTDTLTNKTLTGAAMNGTLGATTPSTASVTTLTTSSTVTHSGGTANGVAYLDGSKVLTTGSALVFDGANLGVGVTPSAWNQNRAIDLGYSGANYASIAYRASTNGTIVANNLYLNSSDSWIYKNTAAAGLYQIVGGAHYWARAVSGTGGTSADSTLTTGMLLDASGNLLVGTTSNLSSRFGVQGASATNADYAIYCQNSSASVLFGTRNDGLFFTGTTTNAPYNFATSGGKALYVNSSGQIGYNSSLREHKTNIVQAPSVDWLDQLNVVSFNYRKRSDDGVYTEEAQGETLWGVIADDAVAVKPDFCSYDSKGNLDGFHYDRLIAPLLKRVQEQQALITQLQADVAALKGA